jgi:hypothetical protein
MVHCQNQWSLSGCSLCLDISAAIEKVARPVNVIVAYRDVQGRKAETIFLLQVSAAIEQKSNQFAKIFGNSNVQWRTVVMIYCMDVGAEIEK